MAAIEAYLRPYYLEAALAADRADTDCFVLDVGRDAKGNATASLKRVIETVDDYLINVHDLPVPITKLYIVGTWNLARADSNIEDQEVQADGTRPTPPGALPGLLKAKETPKYTAEENEWHKAAEEITKFIAQMPALKELT